MDPILQLFNAIGRKHFNCYEEPNNEQPIRQSGHTVRITLNISGFIKISLLFSIYFISFRLLNSWLFSIVLKFANNLS